MKRRLILALLMVAMFLVMCGFREDESKVYDDADLLTSDEEAKLQELCIEKAKETELDIVIVTTDDLGYKSTMSYADDFYDNGMYGYEYEYGSGVLFLIYEDADSDDGEVYISTAGLGILYIDDYDVDDILGAGWDDFLDYEYYDCLVNMLDKTESIVKNFEHLKGTDQVLDDWYDGEYSDYIEFIYDYDEVGRTSNFFGSLIMCGGIAAAVGGIAILCMNSSYNIKKMSVSGANYFKKNSFKMNANYDNFIRTDVSRVRIESSSGGSSGGGHRSGGSSHRSSSGRSHGGGGRRR